MNETTNGSPSPQDAVQLFDESASGYLGFAKAYHDDPAFRVSIERDPRAALTEAGIEPPPQADCRIVVNTEDTFHIVFPPDPNTTLSDEALAAVSGGNCAGSASTIGSVSSVGSVPSCVSSVSSASSVGTAGSAGG